MKSLFLMLLLFFCCHTVTAQNIYYDSKYITDWYRTPRHDSTAIEHARQDTVLTKLYKYFNTESGQEYKIVAEVFREIKKRNGEVDITHLALYNPAVLKTMFACSGYGKNSNRYDSLNTLLREWETAKASLIQFKADSLTFSALLTSPHFSIGIFKHYAYLENLTMLKIDTVTIGKNDTIDLSTGKYLYQESLTAYLKLKLNTIQQFIQINAARKADREKNIKPLINALDDRLEIALVKGYQTCQDISQRDITIQQQHFSPKQDDNIVHQDGQLNSVLLMQPTTQLSNFSVPSQAELIDAMAVYIAERFKQEAIMYMMDKLKKYSVADSLFGTLFPETKKMLYDMDELSIPNFGSDWKYALSKDYTLMPKNIFSSRYIENKFDGEIFKYSKDGWRIAELISKKYNYVDIVAALHIDTLGMPALNNFITWSYIFNQELLTLNMDSVRSDLPNNVKEYWLSAGVFDQTVRPRQLSLMLAMINEKYPIDVNKNLDINLAGEIDTQRARLKQIQSWVSRTLMILNQFQKGQQTIFNQRIAAGERNDFNPVSYWTFVTDIMNTFLDTAIIKIPGYNPDYLTHTTSLYEIYNSLQLKNYSAAVHQTLSVIDKVMQEENAFVSPKLKIQYATFKAQLQEVQAESDFTEARDDLLRYSVYFTPRALREDSAALHAALSVLVHRVDSVMGTVQGRVNEKTVRSIAALKIEMDHFSWKNPDSYEKVKMLRTEIGNDTVAKAALAPFLDGFEHTVQVKLAVLFTAHAEKYHKNNYRAFIELKKHAKLFNDIMAAGNDAEKLADVIESHAAPVGSYKVKRLSRFSIDIGAYLGAHAGWEWLPGAGVSTKPAFTYGLTVPVGINFNFGGTNRYGKKTSLDPFIKTHGCNKGKMKEMNGHSHSIGLSVIDIAAPVAYRLITSTSQGQEQGEGLPSTVKWSQLLAPGLHYRWGIKNAPFTVSFGVQFTPELRAISRMETIEKDQVTVETESVIQANALRFYTGILFDLPLLYIKK